MVITPPLGKPTSLAGYSGRTEYAMGIRDELYASAVVVATEDAKVAVVSLDLLGIMFDDVDAAKALIHEQVPDLPPEHVMIACTHTHQGPDPFGIFRVGQNFQHHPDHAYLQLLPRLIAGAVIGANYRLQPARTCHGRAFGGHLAANRRRQVPAPMPNLRAIDPDVGVLQFEAADTGELLGAIVNFAAHPTIYGSKEPLVSADYVAGIRKAFAERYGPDAVVVYLNGPVGDLVPHTTPEFPPVHLQHDETRGIATFTNAETWCATLDLDPAAFPAFFERLLAKGRLAAKFVPLVTDQEFRVATDADGCVVFEHFTPDALTLAFVKRLLAWFYLVSHKDTAADAYGRALVSVASEAITGCAPGTTTEITLAGSTANVDARVDDPEMAREFPQFSESSHYLERDDASFMRVPVQLLRFGTLLLAGFPGEAINEMGLRVKQILEEDARVDQVMVVGLANGEMGYLLTPKEFEAQGYESLICVGRDAGHQMECELLALGERLLPGARFPWREAITLPDVPPKKKLSERLEIRVTPA